ncbi:MAG: radical SAM protein [Endomicrobiales bacterium]
MSNERFLENKRLNDEEIRRREPVLKSRFTSLICTLGNHCNIQCIMCGVWKDPWSVTDKTFREIMDSLPCLEHVIWLGGEVFLSPYFGEILEESKKYPFIEQRINTNALLINEKWMEKLLQNNVELICSIDGATPKTYEHIRRGGRFSQLQKALGVIREAKKQKTGRKFGIRMNVVVMRSNYRELEQLLELAHEYGFENMQLIGITGDEGPELIFTDTPENREVAKEIEATLEKLVPRAKEYRIDLLNCLPLHKTGSPKPLEPEKEILLRDKVEDVPLSEESFCYLPWQQVLIEPFGHTKFGCWCQEPIGNVSRDSLSEMWNSEIAQKYRRKIARNDFKDYCDQRCVMNEIPRQLRQVNEFKKNHGNEFPGK